MGTILKVALGVVLGVVVLIAGCTALLGVGVEQAEREASEGGITAAEFRAIDQRATQDEVERELGEPEDAQEFEQRLPNALGGGREQSSCIYYPESGQPLFEGASYQLCFRNGRLESKNAY
jgi:hypothetical protein